MSKSLISFAAVAAIGILAIAPGSAIAQADANAAAPTRMEIKSTLDARFKAVDTNNDGTLAKAEIEAANARVAQQASVALAKRMEAEFAQLDSNKDGQISLAEFKAAAPDAKPTPSETTLERLDANKDGKISREEFSRNMLVAFDRLDANKDGRLSEQEQQAPRR